MSASSRILKGSMVSKLSASSEGSNGRNRSMIMELDTAVPVGMMKADCGEGVDPHQRFNGCLGGNTSKSLGVQLRIVSNAELSKS